MTLVNSSADAPRLIGEPLVNATTEGKGAELVCRVKANPPPKPSSVYWRRVIDETPMVEITSSTIADYADARTDPSRGSKHNGKPPISGIRCNQVSRNGCIFRSTYLIIE